MKAKRFTLYVTPEADIEIRALAKKAGVRIGQFCTMALILGARQLARQYEPERFITPELLRAFVEAGVTQPEDIQRALEESQS